MATVIAAAAAALVLFAIRPAAALLLVWAASAWAFPLVVLPASGAVWAVLSWLERSSRREAEERARQAAGVYPRGWYVK